MIEITHNSLDPKAVTDKVLKDTNGAIVTFVGVTRSFTGNRKVLHLEYEAYRPMADKKLAEIIEEIREKWSIQDIALSHRLGSLDIGEISLVLAVAAPHRKDAFTACEYGVTRIKQIVPIWKKEFFEGGEVWVENHKEPDTTLPTKASTQ